MANVTACTDDKDLYKDVRFCQGSKSLPGTRNYAYITKKTNVVTWPEKPGLNAENLKDVAKLIGNFVLAADKKWSRLDLVPNENNITAEQKGAYGSHVFLNTCTLVIPGTEEEATGLAAALNNDDVLVLVPQRNGKFRLLGNEEFSVNVAPGIDTGKGTDDTNGTTLTITVEDEIPAPFYSGKIETNDGDISGATGKPFTAGGA